MSNHNYNKKAIMMFKKIWKDPVWSKVISIGIIGLITLGYTKFLSVTENVTFKDSFQKILEMKISLIYVFLAIVAYWLIAFLLKKFLHKEKGYYTPKQDKLRSYNKIKDNEAEILFKWKVYFDNSGTPFISDLTAFCTKHGEPPIRFINNRCPIQNCKNSKQVIDVYSVKNYVESDLIDKWDK